MKEVLLAVLEQLEPESVDTAELIMGAMSSVTSNVEELSRRAQVCHLLEHFVRRLNTQRKFDWRSRGWV